MKFLSPVVWSEGMHLAQHHFQAQNRYFEDLAAFAFSSVFFRAWGLARCELDANALANGTVALIHGRGTMPDGLMFQFPEDPAPDPIEIAAQFSPVQESHLVLLAIPPFRAGQANCALDAAGTDAGVRYVSEVRPVADEVTGTDEKPVAVARKNFRLLLDAEPPGDLVTMPIARVLRDRRGHFVYDPEYIPPCVQIGGSERLLTLVARLVEILDAKSDAMLKERQATQVPLAEYAAREVANFWLTHAVHAAVAPLRHHLQTRTAHPERLYVDLARLAGALCTFSMDAHPRDLPAYDHEAPTACFAALDRHIRRQLEVVIPTNAVVIPVQPLEPYFWRGKVPDRRCLQPGARWYLGVRSSASRARLATDVPELVKVCSGGEDSADHIPFIVKLVQRGLPGLELEHEPSPPSAISPRVGTQYFSAKPAGPCWTLLVKAAEIGVYVPAAIPDVELEFVVLLAD